jgi:hypothetical protein
MQLDWFNFKKYKTLLMNSAKLIIISISLFLTNTVAIQAQNRVSRLTTNLVQAFTIKDSLFNKPFIDIDEWRDVPVRHRYIHGGFKGTETRFSFHFPPKKKYQARFFQYITPFPDNENLSQGASGEEDKIGFSIASGAYFIETNGGGRIDFTNPRANDPTIGAYRANAASAQFSRAVALEIYGGERPFGYAFGGSGGAYRTIGGFENTDGIWDGIVPYVLGSPMAIPNVFTVRMHAMRILKDKFPQIIDALEPGGSGDMYAGLNEEEKEALLEVTEMGFPPKSWFGYETMGIHGFLVLYQGVVMADRKYFEEDFWNVPGYFGANPSESLLKARIQKVSKIKSGIVLDHAVDLGLKDPMAENERGTADLAWKRIGGTEGEMPVAFQLEDFIPDVDFLGGDLIIKSGAAAGNTLQLTKTEGDKIVLGPADPGVLIQIQPGDEVQVDNSNFLAVQTYHRHQVPGKEYLVWDQFRDKAGNPIYPQRPMLLGPMFTMGAAGSVPTGKFKGKMILLGSLWDREAYPWQCDWYRERVEENLGDKADDFFRLWFTDHALHGDRPQQEDPTRTVSYLGVLQQALRDLSAWVEGGIVPPATTNYKMEDGQIIIPPTAEERKGIQPVVKVLVDGSERTDISVDEKVTFNAIIELPENTGRIIAADWDFEGKRDFSVREKLNGYNSFSDQYILKATFKFTKSGTYFPTLRAVSQRNGDVKTEFARIQNLGRVRVVVK